MLFQQISLWNSMNWFSHILFFYANTTIFNKKEACCVPFLKFMVLVSIIINRWRSFKLCWRKMSKKRNILLLNLRVFSQLFADVVLLATKLELFADEWRSWALSTATCSLLWWKKGKRDELKGNTPDLLSMLLSAIYMVMKYGS